MTQEWKWPQIASRDPSCGKTRQLCQNNGDGNQEETLGRVKEMVGLFGCRIHVTPEIRGRMMEKDGGPSTAASQPLDPRGSQIARKRVFRRETKATQVLLAKSFLSLTQQEPA